MRINFFIFDIVYSADEKKHKSHHNFNAEWYFIQLGTEDLILKRVILIT